MSKPDRRQRAPSAPALTVALAGLAWTTLPGTQQANAHWFALILPLHLLFAWRFWFAPAR